MSEENQDPIDPQQEEQQEPVVEWYIQVGDGKKAGPISFERLQNFAQRGKIQPTTNVRSTEPDAAWLPAVDVSGLFPDLPSEEPKEEAEAVEPEAPVQKESVEAVSVEAVSVEEPSADDVEVTDDSQMVKTPKVLIDLGPKKDEKPKAKKTSAFVIDTGASKKKDDKPVEAVEEAPSEEAVPEEAVPTAPVPEKKEASSPGVKISIGAPAGKKEPKKEKSSSGFKFSIDPDASKKKEEETEEKAAAPVVDDTPPKEEPPAAQPVTQPQPVEKKDASSPGVKISIGAPAKQKTDTKSDKKSGDKSAFKFAVKPDVTSEPKVAKRRTSSDSTVVTKQPKPKQPENEEKTDDSTDSGSKKPKSGGAFLTIMLKIVAVLFVLIAFGGTIGLIVLGKETPGIPYSAVLAVIVFLYGIMTGILAWSLSGVVSTKNE